MKATMKIKVIYLGVLTMLFVLASCHKDDDPIVPTPVPANEANLASLGGLTYPTPHAYAFDLGKYSNANTQNFVLNFANGTNDGTYYSSNTKTVISFDINSASADKISAGTYVLNPSTEYLPLTFTSSYAHFNLEHQSDGSLTGGDRFNDDLEGNFTISYEGDIATIIYKVKFVDNKVLEGSYKGVISYYSWVD